MGLSDRYWNNDCRGRTLAAMGVRTSQNSRALIQLSPIVWWHHSGQRLFPLPPLVALSILALILPPLFCDFIQNNSRTCTEIQTLDHSKHRNGNAHIASLNRAITYTCRFTAEPDGELGVGRVITFMEEKAGFPLYVG